MLKINPEKDLKELEKFGFKPKYDEDTGELIEYFHTNNIETEMLRSCGINIKKEYKPIKKKIRIRYAFKKDKRGVPLVQENKIWIVDNYKYFCTDLDTLYDLIKADLVVKEWKYD